MKPEHNLVRPLANSISLSRSMIIVTRPFVFLLTVLKQVFLGAVESPLHFFTVPLFSPLLHTTIIIIILPDNIIPIIIMTWSTK